MDVLALLLSYVLLYKYVALAVIVYASAVLLPLPSNAMLLAVGAFSSQGYFNFWISLAIAVIANTLGDLTGYGLTRRYGAAVTHALRIDRIRFFDQLQTELRTDAAITVFLTRFAGWLSAATNFLAGLVGVPFATFLFYDFLGNFIEPGAALVLGRIVGSYWGDFSNILELFTGVVAIGVILFILARIRSRITKKYS
jgi:membrane protein DedA with SNARE-associated domain